MSFESGEYIAAFEESAAGDAEKQAARKVAAIQAEVKAKRDAVLRAREEARNG